MVITINNIARRLLDLKGVEVQGKSRVIFTWEMVFVLEVVLSLICYIFILDLYQKKIPIAKANGIALKIDTAILNTGGTVNGSDAIIFYVVYPKMSLHKL
ncbi:MAG TPA: hypothetical protein DCR95_02125 [Desulfobacter sp.]|uniref:hypothetical protein n=1 Tax=Desulfobacter sp. UBA2225 TaxID=1961413 RepID=UPI000E8F3D9F|nr:hypothetical protein [Desulfobacter sp. UBA2225]HAR32906.1 hypothetical protein [Desulfobacter sp.]